MWETSVPPRVPPKETDLGRPPPATTTTNIHRHKSMSFISQTIRKRASQLFSSSSKRQQQPAAATSMSNYPQTQPLPTSSSPTTTSTSIMSGSSSSSTIHSMMIPSNDLQRHLGSSTDTLLDVGSSTNYNKTLPSIFEHSASINSPPHGEEEEDVGVGVDKLTGDNNTSPLDDLVSSYLMPTTSCDNAPLQNFTAPTSQQQQQQQPSSFLPKNRLQPVTVMPSDFEKIRMIGRGDVGKVYLVVKPI